MATPIRDISGDVVTGGGASNIDYGDLASKVVGKFVDVLEAAAILVAGIYFIRIIRRYIQRIETTHEAQKTALNLFEKITTGFLTIILVTLVLKVAGLDITVIVSAVLLGVSFGLKDVTKNYIAGLLILFKSPFEIGDIVKIHGFTGAVEKIEFQYITLKTFDNKEVTIHNADILTRSIVNYSKEKTRRISIDIRLGYGSDMFRATQIFEKVLEAHPKVLKQPKWSVSFKKFTGDGPMMSVRFWIERPANIRKIRFEIAMQFGEAFDEAKIFFPFTKQIQVADNYFETEDWKRRLAAFYGQPVLAAVANQTNGQVHQVLPEAEAGVLADMDEPEESFEPEEVAADNDEF